MKNEWEIWKILHYFKVIEQYDIDRVNPFKRGGRFPQDALWNMDEYHL